MTIIKKALLPTIGIVQAGFSDLRSFVARKKVRCKLTGNRFVIPHDTIPSTVSKNLNKQPKTMKITLLGFLLLTITAIGCKTQVKPIDFDYGHIENSKYVNSYFDFEITIPNDWIVQTKEQMDNLAKIGSELVAGDDTKLKASIKASEINTANLLAVYQYEQGSAVEYNPSFVIVVENHINSPGIKTGSDLLFQSRRLLEQSQFKYDYIDEVFAKEIINGTEFYAMNAEINYMGLNVKQIYYSTIVNRFSFNVIISFVNDQQRLDLLKSINSMKFRN